MKTRFIIFLIFIVIISAYITMRVAIKGKEVEVPSVAGLSILQAKTLLQTKGLFLKESNFVYDDMVPAERIVSQKPAAGDLVKKGRNIWVEISKGSKMVIIPDLIGQDFNKAQNIIIASGLAIGERAEIQSGKIDKGTVAAQNPQPQSLVKRGTKVNILVNGSGEQQQERYIMPSFIGKNVNLTKRALKEVGGIVKISYQKSSDSFDTVISQNPLPGSIIKMKEAVELVVSSENMLSSTRYLPITFEVPKEEAGMKRVKIQVTDDTGTKVVLNEMYNAGEQIEVGVKVKGEVKVEIYVNDKLVEERQL